MLSVLKTSELTVKQRQYLKGLAHNLEPVVIVGDKGLTDLVIKEIEVNLVAHELIKIRIFGDDRELRAKFASEVCSRTNAHFVQHIGKLLVIYRPSDKVKIKLP